MGALHYLNVLMPPADTLPKCEHYRKILKLLALYELLVEYSFVCDEIIGSPNVPSAHSQLCSIYLLVCTSQVTN